MAFERSAFSGSAFVASSIMATNLGTASYWPARNWNWYALACRKMSAVPEGVVVCGHAATLIARQANAVHTMFDFFIARLRWFEIS